MDRLEKIEEMEREVSNGFAIEDLDLNFMTIVGRENIDWLIEQAERVKELEEENAGLHDILEQVEYQEKDKLLAENKRYRERVAQLINYIETTDDKTDRQVHKIHVILDGLLEGEE